MEEPLTIHEAASGEIAIWIDEAGCICLKSRNKYHDPVELSEDEALELANLLIRLVEEIKRGTQQV